jgi:hypothetical protein
MITNVLTVAAGATGRRASGDEPCSGQPAEEESGCRGRRSYQHGAATLAQPAIVVELLDAEGVCGRAVRRHGGLVVLEPFPRHGADGVATAATCTQARPVPGPISNDTAPTPNPDAAIAASVHPGRCPALLRRLHRVGAEVEQRAGREPRPAAIVARLGVIKGQPCRGVRTSLCPGRAEGR